MTGLIAGAALVGVLALGPPVYTGSAVRYNENVMEHVADVRGIARQDCMVAWTQADARDIGTTWLRVVGPYGAVDCLVVDLPRDRDRAALERRGIVVELGFPSRGICGEGWSGRARDCRVRVWVLPDRVGE